MCEADDGGTVDECEDEHMWRQCMFRLFATTNNNNNNLFSLENGRSG